MADNDDDDDRSMAIVHREGRTLTYTDSWFVK
jgi:hypothetical protein